MTDEELKEKCENILSAVNELHGKIYVAPYGITDNGYLFEITSAVIAAMRKVVEDESN